MHTAHAQPFTHTTPQHNLSGSKQLALVQYLQLVCESLSPSAELSFNVWRGLSYSLAEVGTQVVNIILSSLHL
jgi:hypothetical protein